GDNIPQFLIELENTLAPAGGSIRLRGKPYNDIESYFCVGENPDFSAYWDRADDRLYKIRHCMNIQGVVRQLALFEPPINPMALVRAAAAGKDITSVASQHVP